MSTPYQSFQSKVLEMLKSIPADPTRTVWSDDATCRSGRIVIRRGNKIAVLPSSSEVSMLATCEVDDVLGKQIILITCSINKSTLVTVRYRSEKGAPILVESDPIILRSMQKKLISATEDLYFELLETDIR
ncbi:conserved hypothetical protein [Vibrio phage 150E35-1]|nr:conserved hypothetical protein [Vibrio phage 150E35-1]